MVYTEAGQTSISIHALREEGDANQPVNTTSTNISIHALREEGDCVPCRLLWEHWDISIHALREEGDH